MTEARDAVVAALAVIMAALVRTVWGLASRISRLEGRLNGTDEPEHRGR